MFVLCLWKWKVDGEAKFLTTGEDRDLPLA